jgi:Kef-type K+ transport system membrane component KefB
MKLGSGDVAHILLALGVLLSLAHGLGYVFARFRQPAVIGEILGGLLLGPTLLGTVAPGLQGELFPAAGPTPTVLDAIYQLGLLLLMFSAGTQMRALFSRADARTVGAISAAGLAVPFAAGVGLVQLVSRPGLRAPGADDLAFVLVFASAIAVTSIPVVSRIMFDLGILDTAFARIVLAVAVVEDLVLYVVLAVALGQVDSSADIGLAHALGIVAGSAAGVAYHVAVTVAFLAVFLAVGPRAFAWALRQRLNLVKRRNPIAFQLVLMFGMAVACLFLSIVPIFGAFVAGIVVASGSGEGATRAREAIATFALAFFVPVYFAIVGLRLDLLRHFDPLFFVWFLAFACLVKSASVYGGARLAGESRPASTNFAAVMNARGGPGIVLASVAFDAGIITESFYVSLVLLAVVTSLFAGAWLDRVIRGGRRDPRPVAPA